MTHIDAVLARLERLHPKVIDLSLGRIERLLAALGHPERALAPVIHVAGTNGKGSVIAVLGSLLETAGHRVQRYTSPHLVRFSERIRLAGGEIAEEALLDLLQECERANAGAPITYFEITTAAALRAFSREPADILLLETGLGGRLDATNVVARPLVTVITPIGIDHEGYLGSSLAEIAGEKAGILKPGVPAVIAEQPPEAREVILARAADIGAPVYRAGSDWHAEATSDGMHFQSPGVDWRLPPPALAGPHQIDNAGLALACLAHMPGVTPARDELATGLGRVTWLGRLQRLPPGALPEGSALWLDGAHNGAAAIALARALEGLWGSERGDLVLGMLNTKAPEALLVPLAPHIRRVWAVPVPKAPAGRPAEEIAGAARGLDLAARAVADVPAALDAIARDGKPARVLICGSLYLAGAVLGAKL